MDAKQFIIATFHLYRGQRRNNADYHELNDYIASFDHVIALRALSLTVVILHTDRPEEEIRLHLLTMIEPEYDQYSVDVLSSPEGLLLSLSEAAAWLQAKQQQGTPSQEQP